MNQRFQSLLSCLVVIAFSLLMVVHAWGGDTATSDTDPAPASPAGDSGVQFADDFSDAAGASQTQVDGAEPVVDGEVQRNLFTFAQLPRDARGHLRLVMSEDNTVDGPDGKPGVLRMEIAEVSSAAIVSGFVLQGNERFGEITMPGWERGEITLNELRRAFITFRFRAENREDPRVLGATFNLRFEPGVIHSHQSGADFGALIATSRWRTFRRPLASAENLEQFLAVLNGENPETFKLVWGQEGPISAYRPGDSLLIDDLKVSIE